MSKIKTMNGGENVRHALITAGSKGLGRMVTEGFLKKGCSVTVNYHQDEKAVQSIKEEWKATSDRIQFIKGDITRLQDIERIVQNASEKFGRIDYLINNAGPFIFPRKKIVDYSEEEWFEMLNGNLTSVYRLAKKVIPIMRKQGFGRIITYGFQNANDAPGWIHRGPFAAAKTGLVSLTRSIALEEAEYGITANMVLPGIIEPDMKEVTIQAARESNSMRTPHGRSVTGEDIARTILFLCEDDSEMISGSAIDLTGGVDVINRMR
jgi:3-oxoacyl-[acyl-carrier protein] reductase